MKEITLKDILQDLPPGHYTDVKNVLRWTHKGWSDDKIITLQSPELQLHCDNEKCNGIRLFEFGTNPLAYNIVEIGDNESFHAHCYIEYQCQNCKENLKGFFLILFFEDDNIENVDVVKIGEYPFYGPHIPSRLITLIGPDRELFLKGRRCESQSLGIAAFTYYRRVIENQKNRLIDKIISVIETVDKDDASIAKLTLAKSENQFTTAIQMIKEHLPKRLYIQNYNPLTLLHKALSIGVHNLNDEECLENAHSIRVVLTELADRLTEVLKDHNELTNAITNLNNLK
jgi:hypothetical protein